MATLIHLYFMDDYGTHYFLTIEEDIITRHSRKVCDVLAQKKPTGSGKTVVLSGVGFQQLRTVLKLLDTYREDLRLSLGNRSISKAVALQQVIDYLQIEPPQDQVEQEIVRRINSGTKIRPSDMVTIHQAFGTEGSQNQVWGAMIDELGWRFAVNAFTPKLENAMIAESEKYEKLDNAIVARMNEFKRNEPEKITRYAAELARQRAEALAAELSSKPPRRSQEISRRLEDIPDITKESPVVVLEPESEMRRTVKNLTQRRGKRVSFQE